MLCGTDASTEGRLMAGDPASAEGDAPAVRAIARRRVLHVGLGTRAERRRAFELVIAALATCLSQVDYTAHANTVERLLNGAYADSHGGRNLARDRAGGGAAFARAIPRGRPLPKAAERSSAGVAKAFAGVRGSQAPWADFEPTVRERAQGRATRWLPVSLGPRCPGRKRGAS